MKIFYCLLLGLIWTPSLAPAQTSQTPANPSPYWISESGPHYNRWNYLVWETGPGGNTFARTNSYLELQTGMNFLSNGQWVAASDQIVPTSTGAAATNAQVKVVFLGNINAAGAVDLETPDGKHLVSNILGLGYLDTASGQNVLFAEIGNSTGQILPSGNEALYPQAFSNLDADVMYSYTKAGLDQFVVLHQQPPSPAEFGLDPATTEFEIWTEFLNPPVPGINLVQTDAGSDQFLDFGAMQMVRGLAFAIGAETNRVPVIKQWVTTPDQRKVLVEQIPFQLLSPLLQSLPSAPGSAGLRPSGNRPGSETLAPTGRVSPRLRLPPRKLVIKNTPPLKRSAPPPARPGVAADYTILASQTNFTFEGSMTYYVSGPVNLYGTTVIEGGTVLKFNDSGSAVISLLSGVTCKAAAYRPAIFTSKDDGTVGDPISGSTGVPVVTNAPYFQAYTTLTLQDIRVAYAGEAFSMNTPSPVNLTNAQFLNCTTAFDCFDSGPVNLENALFYSVGTVFYDGPNVTAQNVTFDQCGTLAEGYGGGSCGDCYLDLTNCLLVDVTNLGNISYTTNATVVLTSGAGVFQTVGAGRHYLAANSPYRQIGTTNIDPALLADLATKTTYSPIVYSNTTISVATTFSPQAARDGGSDNVDLGYHYDLLDYVFGGVTAAANLTFTPGTAIGWFELPGSGGPGYGIGLLNSITNTFGGTATAPCVMARYSTVQEGGDGLWTDKGWLSGIASFNSVSSDPPRVIANFTHFSIPAWDEGDFRDYSNPISVIANDCEFWSGIDAGYQMSVFATNCLFDRQLIGGECSCPVTMAFRNCTFHGGELYILHDDSSTWPVWIENCAFDSTAMDMNDYSGGNTNITYCNYNAFITNAALTAVVGPHCLTNLDSFDWQAGPLGNYYQPSNNPTINTGSVPASVVGLYHYTVMTNFASGLEIKETNSVVDIGYHYVAVNTNGLPIDTSGNGPDYLLDANGNGLVDSGEIGWDIPGDLGLTVIITQPKNGSVIP